MGQFKRRVIFVQVEFTELHVHYNLFTLSWRRQWHSLGGDRLSQLQVVSFAHHLSLLGQRFRHTTLKIGQHSSCLRPAQHSIRNSTDSWPSPQNVRQLQLNSKRLSVLKLIQDHEHLPMWYWNTHSTGLSPPPNLNTQCVRFLFPCQIKDRGPRTYL